MCPPCFQHLPTPMQQENEKENIPQLPSSSSGSSTCTLYCYCRQPESDEPTWIACDNPSCSIKWYHTRCLKIKSTPKGKWYCPTCRVLPEFQRVTKRSRKVTSLYTHRIVNTFFDTMQCVMM